MGKSVHQVEKYFIAAERRGLALFEIRLAMMSIVIMEPAQAGLLSADHLSQCSDFAIVLLADASTVHSRIDIQEEAYGGIAPALDFLPVFDQYRNQRLRVPFGDRKNPLSAASDAGIRDKNILRPCLASRQQFERRRTFEVRDPRLAKSIKGLSQFCCFDVGAPTRRVAIKEAEGRGQILIKTVEEDKERRG